MHDRRRPLLLLALAGVLALLAVLVVAARPAGPASLDDRTREVASGLRCPACQAETVAESSAPTAVGIRAAIREQLAEGRNPEQVRAYLVERYGNDVLLVPPATPAGRLVWLLPLGAVGVAVATGALVVRRRSSRPGDARTTGDARTPGDARTAGDAPAPGAAVLAPVPAVPAAVPAASARGVVRLRRVGGVLLVTGVAAGTLALALDGALRPRAPGAPATGADQVSAQEPVAAGRAVEAGRRAGELAATGVALDEEGRTEAAAEAYAEALALDPDDTATAFRLGFALARLDRLEESESVLAGVVAARPRDPEALLLLGTVRRQLGRPAAEETLRAFLDVAPEHAGAPKVRAMLGEPQ